MTTQELVEARKRRIRLSIAGYDQTLKLSGKTSLMNIINKIDSTTMPNNEADLGEYIHSLYTTTSNILRFASERAKRLNKRAFQWLQSSTNTEEIWASIRVYATLGSEVYTVSEEAIKYMYDNFISKELEGYNTSNIYDIYASAICKYAMFNKSYDFEAKQITIRVGDMIYSAAIPTKEASIKQGKSDIQLAVSFGDTFEPIATYNYNIGLGLFDGEVVAESEELNIICSNKECPYHKASLAPEYSDGSKRVSCSAEDCKKCKAFSDGVLSPLDLLNAVATVIYSYENKQNSTRVINEGAKVEYGALPLPMNDSPVIIYTDNIDNNEKVIKIINHNEDYIPGTHASPREHSRVEHMRYNPRTGKKDIHVKGCTVNKGYTKTTYEVRTKKHKNNDEPQMSDLGKQMILDLLK